MRTSLRQPPVVCGLSDIQRHLSPFPALPLAPRPVSAKWYGYAFFPTPSSSLRAFCDNRRANRLIHFGTLPVTAVACHIPSSHYIYSMLASLSPSSSTPLVTTSHLLHLFPCPFPYSLHSSHVPRTRRVTISTASPPVPLSSFVERANQVETHPAHFDLPTFRLDPLPTSSTLVKLSSFVHPPQGNPLSALSDPPLETIGKVNPQCFEAP